MNEANAVLSDPDKRKQYDLLGANWDQFARRGWRRRRSVRAGRPVRGVRRLGGARAAPAGRHVRYEFHTASGGDPGFSDFFRMFFSGAAAGAAADRGRANAAADRAARRRGGRGRRSRTSSPAWASTAPPRGAAASAGRGRTVSQAATEIEAPAELTLEEAYHGTKRLGRARGQALRGPDPAGRRHRQPRAAVGQGPERARRRRHRQAQAPRRCTPAAARTSSASSRSPSREALLGAEIPVATLKGRILLTIPAGTQAGRTFRLTGQGMPRLKGDGTGDLYLKVRVVLPTALGDEAREAAEAFLDLVDQPDPRTTTT